MSSIDQIDDMARFKKEIYLYALITAVVFEIISIPIAGLGTEFAYGLCLGTIAAILNFSIMAFTFGRMADSKNTGITVIGYSARLVLSAAACLFALKAGLVSAAGVIAGLLTIKVSIYYLHVIRKKKQG